MSIRSRDKVVARSRTIDAYLKADGTNSRGALCIRVSGVETELLRFDANGLYAQVPDLPAAGQDLGSAASPYRNLFMSGLLNESAADALTGGVAGQATALVLTKEINRFTTVAAGTGAKLPAAAPGLTILVINGGANALQVYGAGVDTIDDVATATGVTQMVGSVVIYACTIAGKWYSNGLGTGYSGSLETSSFADALAAVGTSQATGLQLAATINAIATGAAATGVNLPASAPGLAITVINKVANSIHVYPFIGATDTINGAAAATGIIIGPNTALTFLCTATGAWVTGTSVMPQTQFNTAVNTTGFTATAAQVAGANDVTLVLSGTLGAGANLTLPTVAALVAAMHNAYVGQTFRVRVVNISGGAFSWTVVTNTGWTLNNTMTVAQNTYRDFYVTLVTLTTATLQSLGQFTQSAL